MFFSISCFSQSDLEKAKGLFKKEAYKEAKIILEHYVAANANNKEALEYLGDCYAYLGNWEQAIATYKKLVALNGNVANYHYKYGGAMAMRAMESKWAAIGLLADIESEFKTATVLDTTHIDARWALVDFYVELPAILGGKQAKALTYANQLQKLSPVDGYLAKGFVYEHNNNFAKAEEYLKKAVATGKSVTCYKKLTALYLANNKYAKAIAVLQEAYVEHKANDYLYEIGKIAAEHKIEIEQGKTALFSYISAYIYNNSYPLKWAYYRLAQLFRYQQNKEQALAWVSKALAVDANFEPAKKEKTKILKI